MRATSQPYKEDASSGSLEFMAVNRRGGIDDETAEIGGLSPSSGPES